MKQQSQTMLLINLLWIVTLLSTSTRLWGCLQRQQNRLFSEMQHCLQICWWVPLHYSFIYFLPDDVVRICGIWQMLPVWNILTSPKRMWLTVLKKKKSQGGGSVQRTFNTLHIVFMCFRHCNKVIMSILYMLYMYIYVCKLMLGKVSRVGSDYIEM